MPAPPILARVLRGDRTESVHRGSIAVVDEDGALIGRAGSPRNAIYVRSAAKPFQAMSLLEAGGEEAFRLGSDEIAVICASHGGEPRHIRIVRGLLRRGGFTPADLACGAHLPMNDRSARRLIAAGKKPTALHNNCSGKHAGLLLACRLRGLSQDGYWKPGHPVQRIVIERLADFCGLRVSSIGIAVDGCSLPVFHIPLAGLALGYARLLSRPERGGPGDGVIRARICRAFWESPGMVAGERRFTTDFLEAGPGRWVGKEGAEGVYAIGISGGRRRKTLGIAFKIDDGSTRARDAVALGILSRLRRLPAEARAELARYVAPTLKNPAGLEVGRIVAEVPMLE